MKRVVLLSGVAGLASLLAGAAAAQCTTATAGDVTTVICPGRVDTLQTDRNGVTSGMIGGQVYSGQAVAPGVIDGRLGGQPYNLQGGTAPDPLARSQASTWPPPLATSPVGDAFRLAPMPETRSYQSDVATREALRRRNEALRLQREREARDKEKAQAVRPAPKP